MLRLELPYPPSVNHYWRMWRGRMVISTEGRAYRARVAAVLVGRRLEPLTGDLVLSIECFPPDRRRRDLDNLQKALLDALQYAGVIRDDGDIVQLIATRCSVVPGGRAVVTIAIRESEHAPAL